MQQGEKRPPPNGDDPPGGPNPPKRPAHTFKQIEEAFNLVIVYLQVVLQYIRSQDPDTRPIPLPMVYPGSVHAVPQATPAAAPPAPTLTPPTAPPLTPPTPEAALIPMTPGEDGNTNDQQPAPAVEAARLPISKADEPEEPEPAPAPAPEPVQSDDDDAPATQQPEWNGTFVTSSVVAASGAPAVGGSQPSIEEIPSGDEDEDSDHHDSQLPPPAASLPPEDSQPPQPDEDTLPPDNGPPYTRRQWALRRDDD